LVGKHFEPDVARGLVDAFFGAHAAGQAMPGQSVPLNLETAPYVREPPRIAPGHIIRAGDREVRVLQRLQSPILATLERVLTDEECEQLIGMSRPRLRKTTVVDPSTGAHLAVGQRNSSGIFFRLRENPLVARIDERLASIMNSPAEHSEGLQVLNYGPGGNYLPHFDFLVPSNPAASGSIARSGQRISTLIVYLNDVVDGGETVFRLIWSVPTTVPAENDGIPFGTVGIRGAIREPERLSRQGNRFLHTQRLPRGLRIIALIDRGDFQSSQLNEVRRRLSGCSRGMHEIDNSSGGRTAQQGMRQEEFASIVDRFLNRDGATGCRCSGSAAGERLTV
jgi:prolyl 4-hydroxylase